MNILHVTHRAWPVLGGSERYVQEVARRQVLDGHRVTVLATDAYELSSLWNCEGRRVGGIADERDGVRIRRLPVRCLPFGDLTFAALRRLTWLSSFFSHKIALRLAGFTPWIPMLQHALAQEPADLLFAWNITFEGLTAAVARQARQDKVPWLAEPLLHLGQPRFYTMRHQLALLGQAERIVVQTGYERAFLLKRGLAPECISIVAPGVDPGEAVWADGGRFRRRHGMWGPLVVTLGLLSYNKGTLHLLAAAQKLWQEGYRLTLVLLGSMEEAVQQALERLPEDQRGYCRCLGQVPEEEKWDAIDAADVFALPSRTESFGIVFLEAWLCGKPVVGAEAGAVCNVIEHGTDGLLAPFGDIDALTGALRTLLESPKRAEEMGQRGREKVLREYTWDRQYSRLRVLVDQLMENSEKNERVQCT